MMERFRKRGGFTLLELMIVVVILAILAVVAIFSYKKYMRKARTQEAMGVLGDIKIKQSQFMASYGRYITTSNGVSDWNNDAGYFPAPITPGQPMDWVVDCTTADPTTPQGAFCQLGVRPANATYFQYKTVGWDPNEATLAGDPPNTTIPVNEWQDAGSPMWWYASARTWWDPDDTRPQAAVVVMMSVLASEPIVKEEQAADFAQ